MAKVIVCRYTVYDIVRGESFVAPRWATRDTIARIRGAAIIEPCVEIDETLLNSDGFAGQDFEPPSAGGAVWRSRPMLSAGCLQGWLIAAK